MLIKLKNGAEIEKSIADHVFLSHMAFVNSNPNLSILREKMAFYDSIEANGRNAAIPGHYTSELKALGLIDELNKPIQAFVDVVQSLPLSHNGGIYENTEETLDKESYRSFRI